MPKKKINKIIIWLLVPVLLLVATEIILQACFPLTVSKPVALSPHKTYKFINTDSRLDKNVIHTRNFYGLRGDEPDTSLIAIVAVGGAGTECRFINDGKDWPSRLSALINSGSRKVWLGNAGISGAGIDECYHLTTTTIAELHPEYLLVMSGMEDLEASEEKQEKHNKSIMQKLILPTVISRETKKIKNASLINTARLLILPGADTLYMSDAAILTRLNKEEKSLVNYKKNLEKLLDYCVKNKIKPILISQATLFGDETDPVSGSYLGNLKIDKDVNGKCYAILLKQYNKIKFEAASKYDCTFINLSARMPKDSRYFYDGLNYTNEGCIMVADIIYDEMNGIIK
ncbi:MAG: hypothetical protein H7321_00860 [Bacteroidia bacterium]|nr:hypothetical protein [Bacteroidia bacterium]